MSNFYPHLNCNLHCHGAFEVDGNPHLQSMVSNSIHKCLAMYKTLVTEGQQATDSGTSPNTLMQLLINMNLKNVCIGFPHALYKTTAVCRYCRIKAGSSQKILGFLKRPF